MRPSHFASAQAFPNSLFDHLTCSPYVSNRHASTRTNLPILLRIWLPNQRFIEGDAPIAFCNPLIISIDGKVHCLLFHLFSVHHRDRNDNWAVEKNLFCFAGFNTEFDSNRNRKRGICFLFVCFIFGMGKGTDELAHECCACDCWTLYFREAGINVHLSRKSQFGSAHRNNDTVFGLYVMETNDFKCDVHSLVDKMTQYLNLI